MQKIIPSGLLLLGLLLAWLPQVSFAQNSATTDCYAEEKAALVLPGVRSDLKSFQLANIKSMSTETLRERLSTNSRSVHAGVLFVCLIESELKLRLTNTSARSDDDPKARGRSAMGG